MKMRRHLYSSITFDKITLLRDKLIFTFTACLS